MTHEEVVLGRKCLEPMSLEALCINFLLRMLYDMSYMIYHISYIMYYILCITHIVACCCGNWPSSKGFPTGPRYGPLSNFCAVCSMGPCVWYMGVSETPGPEYRPQSSRAAFFVRTHTHTHNKFVETLIVQAYHFGVHAKGLGLVWAIYFGRVEPCVFQD